MGEKQRYFFVGQQWRLHISHHLWVTEADKIGPGVYLVSPAAKPRKHHVISDMGRDEALPGPAEKQLTNPHGRSLLAAHQPCRSVTSGCTNEPDLENTFDLAGQLSGVNRASSGPSPSTRAPGRLYPDALNALKS